MADRGVAAAMPTLFMTEPGWEHVLRDEWARIAGDPSGTSPAPGWLEVTSDPPADRLVAVAFARQVLPNAVRLAAPSISAWAAAIGPYLVSGLANHDGPWRCHVVSIPIPGGTAGRRRCALIDEAMDEWLRKKQRRLRRTRCPKEDVSPFRSDEAVVQFGLLTADQGVLSILLPRDRAAWKRALSPFPGGIVDVPDDVDAPSRAFKKLVEALRHLGNSIKPGDRCVDLGCSPGGWTWVALNAGAQVTAIDRSPPRSDLLTHPHLEFVKRDAFAYRPQAEELPIDWLLSDVIAFPPRVVDLLGRWLGGRWCRQFIVTVKFRGRDDDQWLERIKTTVASYTDDFLIRRLNANKNEVTVIGRIA